MIPVKWTSTRRGSGRASACRGMSCHKMQPYQVANGENNVDVNAARLRQGFYVQRHAMWHENSIGKMSVLLKVYRAAYDE